MDRTLMAVTCRRRLPAVTARRRPHKAPRVLRRRRRVASRRRPSDGEVRCELDDAVHGHVVVVDRSAEAGRDLDRRVHLETTPDVAADATALQERRCVHRTAAHDDVVGLDSSVKTSDIGAIASQTGSVDLSTVFTSGAVTGVT